MYSLTCRIDSSPVQLPSHSKMIRSTAMKFRAKLWTAAQTGGYAPVEVEEGKHTSEASLEDAVTTSSSPSFLISVEAFMRIVCVIMFLAGAGMMWTSTRTKPAAWLTGSDALKKEVECTERLSVWCKFTYPLAPLPRAY